MRFCEQKKQIHDIFIYVPAAGYRHLPEAGRQEKKETGQEEPDPEREESMRKSIFGKRLAAAVLSAALLMSGGPAVLPQEQAAAVSAVTVQAASAKKTGWVKESAGYCYYVNGKKLTNQWKTISGKKYYLGADGARKTGWYTVKLNGSYRACYFNSKGVYKKSKAVSQKLITALDKLIKGRKITASTDKKAALKKLFNYMSGSKFGYKRAYGFKNTSGWDAQYAQEMLSSKKGSCYHYAAAFAYVAKRATGYQTRICIGTSNAFNAKTWQAHAWVEIKIDGTWYSFDTNAARYSSLRKGQWYLQKSSSLKNKVYKTQICVNVEI